jgi:hypothetical protein
MQCITVNAVSALYWYNTDALHNFQKMELQVPAIEETTEQEVVASTNDNNFLEQIMKQHRHNEHGVTNSEQTGVQQRVEQTLEKKWIHTLLTLLVLIL